MKIKDMLFKHKWLVLVMGVLTQVFCALPAAWGRVSALADAGAPLDLRAGFSGVFLHTDRVWYRIGYRRAAAG